MSLHLTCYNCDTTMKDQEYPNDIEYFLINRGIEDQKETEYRKIIDNELIEIKKGYGDYSNIWFNICSDLGKTVWICPKCKMLYVLNEDHIVEAAYQKVDHKKMYNEKYDIKE